jgi:hypothetical protein
VVAVVLEVAAVAVINLSNQKNVGQLLAAASCALLSGVSQSSRASELDKWDFEAAMLLYTESDNRVSAVEPVISATRNWDSETSLHLKFTADTLTGASPNGATPSDQPQTFTSPSGAGSYVVEANANPLDPSFSDRRTALSVNWNAPINRDWAYAVGSNVSTEQDYLSIATNGSVSRYLNQKNTTLTLGTNVSFDFISPAGGTPDGLSMMPEPVITSDDDDDDDDDHEHGHESDVNDKQVLDLVLGITQVLNRSTLMQFNYSISYNQGYLTDPYKFVSVIDDNAGANYGGNFQIAGDNVYLYEQRPDSRLKQSIYWQTKHQFGNKDILNLGYRYMSDDWGVQSSTVDLSYRLRFSNQYIEPQFRWYQQTAADFYQRYLTSSDYTNVENASADYRLGDLTTLSVGLRYGRQVGDESEIYTRATLYQQNSSGDAGFGKLTEQELYPDMTAFVWMLGYRF